MGKRELLLVVAFLIVGVVVYQATAPPRDPSRPGFSASRWLDEVRREIRGRRETAERRETKIIPVPEAVQEIRLALPAATITVIGEDRADIEADYHVRSTGYDTAEARKLVDESFDRFKVDSAGALLILTFSFPREARQTATLTLKVPSRLGLRLDSKNGLLKVSNLASLHIGSARGETQVQGIEGLVSLNQRASSVSIDGAGAVRARRIRGAIELDSRHADVRFEELDAQEGRVRVNATGGEIEFAGLRTEARVDARQTEVRIAQAVPAPLTVYNDHEGHDAIALTLAGGGAKIDAMTGNGNITLDEKLAGAGLEVRATGENENSEHRVEGSVGGGGPLVTLRATRGHITIRSR